MSTPDSSTAAAVPGAGELPEGSSRALLDFMPGGALILASDGTVAYLNGPAAALWGILAPAAVGRHPAQVQPAVLPPALLAALAQPAGAPADYWLPHTQQWISLRITPAPNGQCWVFWDNITARKQAEAAQRHDSQLLLAVEAVARTGSYESDLTTGSIYFSDGMYRLFGEAPQSFVPTLDFVSARSHPTDVATVRQVLAEAVDAKRPYTYRRRIRQADGTLRTLEAHGEVLCDAAGNPVRLRGLVQDISERVQAEQDLQASHELLQRTIDSSLDLVQVFKAVRDEQGAVVDFAWVLNNAAAERLYGNVIGQRLLQLNPGVVEAGIFDTFKQVLETGVPNQSEWHYVHEQFNGWFFQSTVKLDDGVTTTTHDITARKQAEQEIRETKELLQATLDSSHYVVHAFKAVRDASGKIVDFTWILTNQVWIKQYGGDMVGKSLLQENPGVVETGLFDLFVQVTETGVPLDHEQYYAHEQFAAWFHQTMVRMGDGFVMNTIEITARKQAEADILRLKEEIAQQAADKYHALFHRMDQGFCVLELLFDDVRQQQAVDFRYLELNPVFARQSGLDARVQGSTARTVLPDLEPFWFDTYGKVALTGEAVRVERYVPQVSRWFDAYAFRVGAPEARQVAVLFNDITARKHTEDQLRNAALAETFRLQLADALGPLTDAAAIQEAVTRLARLHFGADRCYYCEIEEAHAIVRRDAAADGLPSVAGTYPLAEFALLQAVIKAGRPFIIRDVRQDPSVDEALRQRCEQLQVISCLNVPVMKNGQPAGVLCLVQREPRDWTAADSALAAEVAERTWAAVERARAEDALRISEAKYRTLFESIDEGFCLVELLLNEQDAAVDYRFLEVNLVFERQTGLTALSGRLGSELTPGTEPVGLETYGQVVRTGQPVRFESYHASTGCWYEAIASRVDGGSSYQVVIVFNDITARKLAEKALRESEQRLRVLIENLPGAAVFIVDGELRYLLAEGEALQQMGYKPGDFQGRRVRQMVPPEQWSTYHGQYSQALAGQSFEHEHEQGGRTFLTRGVPLSNPSGAVEAVLAVSYDITARRQGEVALQMSEAKYRTLFDSMDQGYCIIQMLYDAAGRPIDWRYLEVNPAFEKHNGLPGALGKTIRELTPNIEQKWMDIYGHVAATGESRRFEENSDALHRSFDLYAFRVGEPGAGQVAVLFTNITERKWAEEALRASQAQLAELNTQLEQRVARRTQQLQANRDLLQSVLDTSLISMSVLYAVRNEAGEVQDFRLGLVNKELERETGRTDLVGQLYAEQYPGIRQVGIFDLMLRTLATGEPQGMEYFYDHEGFHRWFACQFVQMGDGVVATNLNITERKMAEQERLKNLRLLEQSEAVAGLGSWDYDLATGTLHWSEGMYHLFGRPVGSPVAPSCYLEVVVDEDRARAEQLVRRLTAGEGFEDTLRLRVGAQVKTVRIKAVVLRDEAQDQPVRVLGVDLDISELQRLEADNLHLRLTQQQALFEAVQAAQEAERKRMAESLHNGIGQILYATKLRLDRLHVPLLGHDPALTAARREADQLLAEAIRQTRALSHELVPMVLEEFGLESALQDIKNKMSTSQLRLHSQIFLDETVAPLSPALQMALYRIAQELAQNIVKHAHGATAASLELETMPGWVLLRAEDNGPGFSLTSTERPGLGLRSIRDRVALLGGQMETGNVPTGGAYVRIRIPLPVAAAVPPMTPQRPSNGSEEYRRAGL